MARVVHSREFTMRECVLAVKRYGRTPKYKSARPSQRLETRRNIVTGRRMIQSITLYKVPCFHL